MQNNYNLFMRNRLRISVILFKNIFIQGIVRTNRLIFVSNLKKIEMVNGCGHKHMLGWEVHKKLYPIFLKVDLSFVSILFYKQNMETIGKFIVINYKKLRKDFHE